MEGYCTFLTNSSKLYNKIAKKWWTTWRRISFPIEHEMFHCHVSVPKSCGTVCRFCWEMLVLKLRQSKTITSNNALLLDMWCGWIEHSCCCCCCCCCWWWCSHYFNHFQHVKFHQAIILQSPPHRRQSAHNILYAASSWTRQKSGANKKSGSSRSLAFLSIHRIWKWTQKNTPRIHGTVILAYMDGVFFMMFLEVHISYHWNLWWTDLFWKVSR